MDKQILQETYCEEGSTTTPELVYLINTYPPIQTDRIAQAARQAAVWHFTNAADLQSGLEEVAEPRTVWLLFLPALKD